MKLNPILFTVFFSLIWMIQAHAQAVGAVAEDKDIAIFDAEGNLTDAKISDYEGNIIVLYYFSPWCSG